MQSNSPFASAWEKYFEKGWEVFDLPFERKDPPRTGATGRKATALTADDLQDIAMGKPKNIGLHTPQNVIGLDVDADYIDDDGIEKVGMNTLRKLESKYGDLPPTFISTSRDINTESGIRFFRVPEGLEWSDPGKDIETVWWGHRYAVVWPSKHPEGGTYKWYSSQWCETLPPEVSQLPELPDEWVRALSRERKQNEDRQGGIDFSDDAHIENHVGYALSRLEEADGEYHKLIYLVSAALTAATYARAHKRDENVDEDILRTEIENTVLERTPWSSLDSRDHRWIRDGIQKNRDSHIVAEDRDREDGRITSDTTFDELVHIANTQRPPLPEGDSKQEHGIAAREIAKNIQGDYCYQEGIGWMQWTGTHWDARCPVPVSDAVITLAEEKKKAAQKVLHAIDKSGALESAKQRKARLGNMRGGKGEVVPPTSEEVELGEQIEFVEEWIAKWKQVIKWWDGVTSGQHHNFIMNFASKDGRIYTQSHVFDSDQHLLNTANGTVDLRTKQVHKHDPKDRISKIASYSYYPNATHKSLDKALEAEHPDIREWLQMRRGAMLFGGENREESVLFNFGKGSNGKSTMTNVMLDVLGDYAVVLHDKALLGNPNDHPAEQMIFKGARVAVLEELPEGQILRPQLVKKLVGTGQISARLMRQNIVTFDTTHSIIVNSNHEPQVPEQDYGTKRRLMNIPWPFTFRPSDEPLRNEFDLPRDTSVKADLKYDRAAKEAALAYLIEGAFKYYQNGFSCGDTPQVVKDATRKWLDDNDPVKQLLDDYCQPDSRSFVSVTELLDQMNSEMEGSGKRQVSSMYMINRVPNVTGYEEVEYRKVKESKKLAFSSRSNAKPSSSIRALVGLKWKDHHDE